MENNTEDEQNDNQESRWKQKLKLWLKEFLGTVFIVVFLYFAGRDKDIFKNNIVVTKNECKLVCTGTLDEDSFAVYECKVFDMPGSKVYQITTHPKKTSK